MWFKSKPKSPAALSFTGQLEALPQQNQHVTRAPHERGIVITVELVYNGMLSPLAKTLKLRRAKKYWVDGLQLEIYQLIDGQRSVALLIEWLAERFQLGHLEARSLMVQYLAVLLARGLIAIPLRAPAA